MSSISDTSVDDSVAGEEQENLSLPKSSQKRIYWTIPVLIVLIISGMGIYLVSRRQKVQPNIESLTVPVKTQTLSVRIEANGSIEPIASVNISPKTTGRLVALYVEQGDEVKAGQILARMDAEDFQAELTHAQAELAQARAEYTRVLNGNRREAIARAKSQVLSAQAQADLSSKKLAKNRFLAQEGAIAQLTLDEYISENQTALAHLAEAQEQLRELETGSRIEDIEQSQAKVAAAQAQVATVKIKLEDTKIRAPFDGIVSQKYATVGAIVTPNVSASSTSSATSTSILSIASELEVKVSVSEINISHIKPLQQVEIIADAYPYRTFAGKVKQIAPEAIVENNVTSFEVTVELITGKSELRSGMNIDALFIGNQIKDALTIPTVAITTDRGQIGVMVASDRSKAEFKPVRIGFSQDGQTQIIQGLATGDRVFIDTPPEKRRSKKISLP